MNLDGLSERKAQIIADLMIELSKEKDQYERVEIKRMIREIVNPQIFLKVIGVHRHVCDKCGKRWVHQSDFCADQNEIDTRLSCQKCG